MEEALRALLAGDAAIIALVSNRIYWDEIPQGVTGDAIVLHKISGTPNYTYRGPSSLKGSRVQINSRAATVIKAWAISRAVEAKLSGFRGPQGSVNFGAIFLENDAELPSDSIGADVYRGTRSDYAVWSDAA